VRAMSECALRRRIFWANAARVMAVCAAVLASSASATSGGGQQRSKYHSSEWYKSAPPVRTQAYPNFPRFAAAIREQFGYAIIYDPVFLLRAPQAARLLVIYHEQAHILYGHSDTYAVANFQGTPIYPGYAKEMERTADCFAAKKLALINGRDYVEQAVEFVQAFPPFWIPNPYYDSAKMRAGLIAYCSGVLDDPPTSPTTRKFGCPC